MGILPIMNTNGNRNGQWSFGTLTEWCESVWVGESLATSNVHYKFILYTC